MTIFLSGVPGELVRAAFDRAGGNEIASGKFASPESSAALAANGFGWFMDRPTALPAFPVQTISTGRRPASTLNEKCVFHGQVAGTLG